MSNDIDRALTMKGHLTNRDRMNSANVARDLRYGESCVAAIMRATTETQINRILIDARHGRRDF